MKRANYYKVHPNKKPKAKFTYSNTKQIYLLISKMIEFVNTAKEYAIALKKIQVPTPTYKKGGSMMAIVGDNSEPEYILPGGTTAHKLTENNKLFLEKMKKIAESTNTIFNTKPAY